MFRLGLALAVLTGCGGANDVILPGERIDVRPAMVVENQAPALALPAPRVNADWTHRGGNAQHRLPHPALAANLTLAFTQDIGAGNNRRHRITADPIVLDGRVFTLDSAAQVSAVSTAGELLWSHDLTPAGDGASDASGGGMAAQDGTLFVTTGFGRITALNAVTGAEIWSQDLNAPGSAAPTVSDGLVFVVSRDSRAWALEAETGRIKWQSDGTPSASNVAGGAGVAVSGDIAIFPFPSGEVLGAFPQGGLRRWSSIIAGNRVGEAVSVAANDIGADPVIDGNVIYVGNVSGRVAALRLADGERLWTAVTGATSPIWVEAGSLFLVNDINELIRLNASDGSITWHVQLPVFEQEANWRQHTRYVHFGPILAGGRLIVGSSDGLLRQFDPVSGASLGDVVLPAGAASLPVVAGNVLYIILENGQLAALR
ncbi:MAG: PQQ-binding-like beta-propeller repeat protein [Rhodobacteraceae bacterium]|nr:PQQ-binding-like beta-propeller repeat protein [Paracoccaceae bacterium]